MRRALGSILLVAAAVLLGPLAILPFYPAELALAPHFLLPALALALGGTLLRLAGSRGAAEAPLDERSGSLVVTLAWLLANLACAWPFMGIEGLSFSQAFFEAMSGLTTTGLSMVDVERAPKILLLFRSLTQLAGGAGLAIFMMAAFSLPIGAGLYRAEGRNYQLVPNVTRSAKVVVILYLGYAAAGTLALILVGMSPFEALNHSFCAVSTGGFSTKASSIGYWNSPPVEAVIILLMIVGNLNFLGAYALFRGKWKAFLRNSETKLFAVLALASIALLFLLVVRGAIAAPGGDGSLGKELRVAVFEAISALTTTGYSTVSYLGWKTVGLIVLISLMIVGGGMCSTAGGLKQYRVYVLSKAVWWEMRRMMLPRQAVLLHRAMAGEEEVLVDDRRIREIGVFAFLYLATFTLGSGILAASGYDLGQAAFEFASALGTVGLSLGLTSTSTPPLALWTMSAGMFLGRLEFFVIFVSVAELLKTLIALPSRGLPRRPIHSSTQPFIHSSTHTHTPPDTNSPSPAYKIPASRVIVAEDHGREHGSQHQGEARAELPRREAAAPRPGP